jgi:hypothetical protein
MRDRSYPDMDRIQMLHAASIAHHLREQAAQPLLQECNAIEHLLTLDEKYYATDSIDSMYGRISDAINNTCRQMREIANDMIEGYGE